MNNHQLEINGTDQHSSGSYFELQNFYLKLPRILGSEGSEKTANPSDNLSDCADELDCSTPSCFQMFNNNGLATRPSKDQSHGKNEHSFQSRDTLQSLVQSCAYCNRGQQKSTRRPSNTFPECKHVVSEQNKPVPGSLRNSSPYTVLCFEKNVVGQTGNHQSRKHQQEKPPQVSFSGSTSNVTTIVVSEKEMTKNTKRIRWTEDLHKKFIESVNRLGGAKKATPKGILKLMNCDGLTIFHIKSHLQKYRCGQIMPDATEGNAEQLDSKTGMQIVEALRLQMDVQRRLYEQLESQKKLQMRIEEQAKQLQAMIRSQSKTKEDLSSKQD